MTLAILPLHIAYKMLYFFINLLGTWKPMQGLPALVFMSPLSSHLLGPPT